MSSNNIPDNYEYHEKNEYNEKTLNDRLVNNPIQYRTSESCQSNKRTGSNIEELPNQPQKKKIC